MIDADDVPSDDPSVQGPEGYSRPVNREMLKAPPRARDAGATLPDDDELARAAKTVTQAPAAPDHGRPRGANNALAFHQFKKGPKPDSGPKSDGDG